MRPYLLYVAAAIVTIAVLAAALSPFATVLVDDWSRRDVELRSKLVFNSIRDYVAQNLAEGGREALLVDFFERLAEDEKLIALGYCDAGGTLRHPTKLMPSSFSCEKLARADSPSFSIVVNEGRRIFVAAFPIDVRAGKGHLAILHDLSFIAGRSAEVRWYWSLVIAGVALGLAGLAAVIVMFILRRWLSTIRGIIEDARQGLTIRPTDSRMALLDADVRQLIRDLQPATHKTSAIHVEWSPRVLQALMAEELPGAQVIVVSNRQPYIHNQSETGIELQIPASGLVAALEPVMRACGGTWVAHGSGTADRATVDRYDRIKVPPAAPAYTLRRVWLTDDELDGYYYGFANEGLWPLCHISFVRPNFREADWQTYRAVNERFADAIASEATTSEPVILVQDYHFAVLPGMLRERLPGATIVCFWHIPWPNAETFSICPWKEEIIKGMLGSTVLGFHTQFHCNNFIETVDRFVESRIDRECASVTLGGHETIVRPYPISIAWPPAALADQPPVSECHERVRQRLGLAPDVRLGVGVERFDYTKGVLDRLRGVDELLTQHPEWRGRFIFVQAAAPTRSKLDAYRALQTEAADLARQLNEKHGFGSYQPIRLVVRHHEPDEVFELFRAADVCVVSSLHDGMNLVAKEFVAARDDEEGVLVLSHFAGASRELSEALIVNPYDAHEMGDALHQALTMPKVEQQARMRLLRALVREYNVYRWAGQMLLDVARLRRRQRIVDLIGARGAA